MFEKDEERLRYDLAHKEVVELSVSRTRAKFFLTPTMEKSAFVVLLLLLSALFLFSSSSSSLTLNDDNTKGEYAADDVRNTVRVILSARDSPKDRLTPQPNLMWQDANRLLNVTKSIRVDRNAKFQSLCENQRG